MIDLTNLADAAPLDGTELVAMLQGGVWVKAPLYFAVSIPTPVITAVPTAFTGTAISDVQIDLAWTGLATFILQRCRENDGAWVTIYTGTTASFSDPDLFGDETYYYRVNDTDTGEFTSDWATTNATTLGPT